MVQMNKNKFQPKKMLSKSDRNYTTHNNNIPAIKTRIQKSVGCESIAVKYQSSTAARQPPVSGSEIDMQ